MVRLGRWFGVARRSVYYKRTKAPLAVKPALAEPIKVLIEEEPSFGYRTVAGLLGMNKNGAACLPAQRLVGTQAGVGQATEDRGLAIGGDGTRPALGDGPVPGLGVIVTAG